MLNGIPIAFLVLKVTAILLNGWILPISAASAVKGPRLQAAQQACLNGGNRVFLLNGRTGTSSYKCLVFTAICSVQCCAV